MMSEMSSCSCNIKMLITVYIQGESGGKVNILGDGSVGNREEKVHVHTCLILNGYWDRAVWIYKYKNIKNNNKQKQELFLI
jgi:hypothetical protein